MTKRTTKAGKAEEFVPIELKPLTTAQATFLEALDSHECTLGVGAAGTGKTFVACSWAAKELRLGYTSKIVLTKPTVPVGRSIGFTPGGVQEKMMPWARPLLDAFRMSFSKQQMGEMMQKGIIEILPLEYVRGLSLDETILIIDEAQNTLPVELHAFLTRAGRASRLIVCGDSDQKDIPNRVSGLDIATCAVENGLVKGAALVRFDEEDIVRSEQCKQWAKAWPLATARVS